MTLGSFLSENPQAAFGMNINKIQNPSLSRYFSSQYNNLYTKYLGELGRLEAAGQTPTMDFNTFLGKQNWLNNYFGMAPQVRGSYSNQFAPAARFLNY